MATPRRRIVRPISTPVVHLRPDCREQKLRSRLSSERSALARWQTKLRRAFNMVERLLKSIGRIEKQLARQEE